MTTGYATRLKQRCNVTIKVSRSSRFYVAQLRNISWTTQNIQPLPVSIIMLQREQRTILELLSSPCRNRTKRTVPDFPTWSPDRSASHHKADEMWCNRWGTAVPDISLLVPILERWIHRPIQRPIPACYIAGYGYARKAVKLLHNITS